jgi:hypothetical protein
LGTDLIHFKDELVRIGNIDLRAQGDSRDALAAASQAATWGEVIRGKIQKAQELAATLKLVVLELDHVERNKVSPTITTEIARLQALIDGRFGSKPTSNPQDIKDGIIAAQALLDNVRRMRDVPPLVTRDPDDVVAQVLNDTVFGTDDGVGDSFCFKEPGAKCTYKLHLSPKKCRMMAP